MINYDRSRPIFFQEKTKEHSLKSYLKFDASTTGDGEKWGGCVSIVVKNGKTRLLEPSLILGIREYHTLVTSKKIQQSSITLADLFISKKIWCTKEYVFLTKNTIKIAFVVLCTIISHI